MVSPKQFGQRATNQEEEALFVPIRYAFWGSVCGTDVVTGGAKAKHLSIHIHMSSRGLSRVVCFSHFPLVEKKNNHLSFIQRQPSFICPGFWPRRNAFLLS
jgi:hypothetical protein